MDNSLFKQIYSNSIQRRVLILSDRIVSITSVSIALMTIIIYVKSILEEHYINKYNRCCHSLSYWRNISTALYLKVSRIVRFHFILFKSVMNRILY